MNPDDTAAGVDAAVVPLDRRHTADAARLIALAWADLEIARRLVPGDAAERLRCLTAWSTLHIDHAHRHGGVSGVVSGTRLMAAAAWLSQVGATPLPPPPGYADKLHQLTGRHYREFRALDDTLTEHCPRYRHERLIALATEPRHQNQGFATRLVIDYLGRLDDRPDHRPALYVVACTPSARAFYGRHGFRPAPPIGVPHNALQLTPMFRHAGQRMQAPPDTPDERS